MLTSIRKVNKTFIQNDDKCKTLFIILKLIEMFLKEGIFDRIQIDVMDIVVTSHIAPKCSKICVLY